jgi:hypothetical protein
MPKPARSAMTYVMRLKHVEAYIYHVSNCFIPGVLDTADTAENSPSPQVAALEHLRCPPAGCVFRCPPAVGLAKLRRVPAMHFSLGNCPAATLDGGRARAVRRQEMAVKIIAYVQACVSGWLPHVL